MTSISALPYVGAVIRYGYLWRDEARRGATTPRKDRPCVVLAIASTTEDEQRVYVAPITHSPPKSNTYAIALNDRVRRRLGLDTKAPSWLIANEVNAFVWRGVDVLDTPDGRSHFGTLAPVLVEVAQERFRQSRLDRTVGLTDRL